MYLKSNCSYIKICGIFYYYQYLLDGNLTITQLNNFGGIKNGRTAKYNKPTATKSTKAYCRIQKEKGTIMDYIKLVVTRTLYLFFIFLFFLIFKKRQIKVKEWCKEHLLFFDFIPNHHLPRHYRLHHLHPFLFSSFS